MTVIHHKSKNDYLSSLNKKNIQNLDLLKSEQTIDSLKNEVTKTEPVSAESPPPELSTKPTPSSKSETPHTLKTALESAKGVAKSLIESPPLPIGIPTGASLKVDPTKATTIKNDGPKKYKPLEKPAVIFIEGFELFSSGGNGLKEMAENFKDAIHFTWKDKDAIIEKIKKHAENQKVVLVGHSFGADSAVEIAEELNTLKHGFRNVDLMVTLDAVGFNHHVIPVNVKRNLNFFAEGRLPLLHGTAHVARNPDHTAVHNELRNETHMEIDDSRDLQFEIFDEIKRTLGWREQETTSDDIVIDDIVETIEEGRAPINIIIINNEPDES